MKVSMTLLGAGSSWLLPLSAQAPTEDPLLRWMDKIAQEQLDAREKAIAAVRTVADAERRKEVVRRKILDALGGLPDYSGPLNARVTGQIQADGYVIEKVIYESLPGYYVTANLYRPNQPGRYPAVLATGRPHPGRQGRAAVAGGKSGAERFRVAGLRPGGPGRKGADLRSATQGAGGGLVGQ